MIWKAKEFLNIFPTNRNARVEADIVDALTVRLPNLGVNLLPMAFRQIKDPMEIIKLAINCQSGAYLNIDELVEIPKLLGLSSREDNSAVQEAIAREAELSEMSNWLLIAVSCWPKRALVLLGTTHSCNHSLSSLYRCDDKQL
ncbi:MAG2-interacting protein 2-like [Olea europaea var. sylvestris]|uniref:MAG2-interacting protein 2-like n=1 Tax=Olea europaea var. sylvestris TaxID=158386 RepID=UPI000C1CE324|nr:MAG2-interacting protein 2-like [Olea europaea var. sylvestris]